ncbi:hypothetical protein D1159_03750 [Pseudoflavonifractor sp. 524-17]|nr:hypothetical protein [Pseudoflavonifractor sp. 524-17]
MVTIIAALAVPFLMVLSALIYRIGLWTRPQKEQLPEHLEPFVISEYYARTEQAAIDILETQEPVDQTIILWWGLDGLRLTEDGKLEWVSRRKPRPVDTGELRGFGKYMVLQNPEQQIAAQMEQMRQQINQPMEQTTAQIDQQINSLRAQNGGLELQMIQNLRAAAVMSLLPMPGYMGYRPQYQLTQCCVQHPAQYPPYFYGGCCGNYVG